MFVIYFYFENLVSTKVILRRFRFDYECRDSSFLLRIASAILWQRCKAFVTIHLSTRSFEILLNFV